MKNKKLSWSLVIDQKGTWWSTRCDCGDSCSIRVFEHDNHEALELRKATFEQSHVCSSARVAVAATN